jgi:KDO2-lipid IV(A) lauroyltransferase
LRQRTDATALERAEHEQRAAGRSVGTIYLTPHLGSFELSARAYAMLAPITVLYKPPRRDDLHAVLRVARSGPRLKAVPTDAGGIRALVRALRQGQAIGVLPDQVPTAGDGSWAPFFGRLAFTMTLPARLVERTGARVFILATRRRRLARGWTIEVRPVEGVPSPARINAAVESMIRAAPDQYYWDYNRYKVPAGMERPDEVPAQ